MRWLTIVGLAVGCSGEGKGSDSGSGSYTEDEYVEDFVDKFCDTLVTCGGGECDLSSTSTTTTTTRDCEYFPEAARDCIDAEWGCEDQAGFSFPKLPDVCATAYVCETTTSTTY